MTPADRRLAELAEAHALDPPAVERLRALLDVVAGDPHAPTTVTARDEAVDRHVADSLSGLVRPELASAADIADLGAGAGFPGLVIAAVRPEARVALVESVERKCAFLRRAREAAGVGNARVVCARAEAWAAGREANDAVVARAVASLPVLLEYAAPLLREGGALVAWKGAVDPDEESAGRAAADVLGLEHRATEPVRPWPGAERRTLHVYVKVRPTPAGYPRRPGMARKRPLGA